MIMEREVKIKSARRYNADKLRYELIPSKGLEYLAEVYTKGAKKYTLRDEDGVVIEDGANNWRTGMSWMDTIASVQRHIEQWKSGEEIDKDLGTRHLANAAWGLFTLLDYETSRPQFDDRPHAYLNRPKIGLDIDEVLADWVGAWTNKFGYERPTSWHFSYENHEHFKSFSPEELSEFYLNIPRKMDPQDIPFEPHCYITSRSVPIEITKAWIQNNGFPTAPIYSVGFGVSKIDVARESGMDIFVDDRYDNFVELNKAGICTYLWDTPHNRRYDVGYKRIKSLKELV